MKLTDEQIVKLIADAFRVGRNEGMEVGSRDGYENGLRDGHDEGYTEGYEAGWDKGYDAAEKDAEDTDDDYECKCLQCMNPREYDMGWEDGFNDRGVDLDMGSNKAYLQGFSNGHDDRENGEEEV